MTHLRVAGMKRYTALTRKLVALAMLNLGLILSHGAAAGTLDDIKFAALPGDKFEIQMVFSESVPEPKVYSIDNPARIVLDFEGAQSTLAEKKYALPFENAQSVVVLTAGDRTRVIVNLKQAAPYAVEMAGNIASLNVGGGNAGAVAGGDHASIERSASGASRSATGGVTDIDFKRGEKGEGMLTVTLANPKTEVDIAQQGKNIVLKFFRTSLPEYLDRKLDVLDFATPVSVIDSVANDGTTTITLTASGEYDYQAYQADDQYVVSVKPLTRAEQEERQNKFAFVGKKLSLNFQDIEVRSVLQLIADFTDLNLVASDTVTGNITLRLENVPWDQALAIVLKAKGLDKRQEGNVLMVAPAVEIAERERLQVEANKQLIELAPLVTEFVRIRYADAGKLFELFNVKKGQGGGGGANKGATSSILSERGTAIVDKRTNTIILTDVEEKLAEFRRLVREIDIPIRQVEIEARIVIANTEFRKEMGVRWGAQGLRNPGNGQLGFGGSLENFSSPNNPIENFGGSGGTILVNEDALAVDLGVANPTGRFALELLTNNTFLDLELSAAQNDGTAEVVSQPKVLTGDKQKAVIRAGTEIAYRSQTSSGATDVEFKEAVLKLEVTPQITPDNRVIMDLVVSKDSVQEVEGGGEPRINITDVTTQALVGDGQTLVLGGIFEMEEERVVAKVPLLGDIPLVGNLFRNKIDRRNKREILIFITPRIVNDALLDR